MAFIIDRAGTYYAAFNIDGKRKVLTTKIKVGTGARQQKKNRELAQAQADLFERTANGDIDVEDAIATLRTLAGVQAEQVTLSQFLTKYKAGGKPDHVQRVDGVISRFIEFMGANANIPLSELKASHLNAFYDNQLERVSYGTVRQYYGMLSTAFNSAVADDLIIKNPHMGVKLPKKESEINREPFTINDLKIIRAKFPTAWVDAVNICLWLGGQRLGDVVTLQWSSIDFDAKLVTIKTGKTGKTVYNPLLPQMEARLLEIKELQDENEIYVMPDMAYKYNRDSSRCLSAQFTNLLKLFGIINNSKNDRTGDKRNLSPKSFHSLRHTVVTLLRSNLNISADVSRAIVGHDSELVERAYSQPDMQSKLDAMTQLDNLIG